MPKNISTQLDEVSSIKSETPLKCDYSSSCGACQCFGESPEHQKIKKIKMLRDGLFSVIKAPVSLKVVDKIEYWRPQELKFRDRMDFQIEKMGAKHVKGFRHREKKQQIVDIEKCPLLNDELQELLLKFRQIQFPLGIQKGSIRLRAFKGLKGIWLDFSNKDIQLLFEEKGTLHHLLKLGIVEIGQRQKRLIWDDQQDRFRLINPQLEVWSQTFIEKESPNQDPIFNVRMNENSDKRDEKIQFRGLSLYSTIAGFTQPGSVTNELLIKCFTQFLNLTESTHWFEFGGGNGNLTFPLVAKKADFVEVFEFDARSILGLEIVKEKILNKKIMFRIGDFQRAFFCDLTAMNEHGLLLNPPRSGVGQFLDPFLKNSTQKSPREIIYISCYLESFLQDVRQLTEGNFQYSLEKISIVDQFPHTNHFEIVSLWKRN